MRRCVALSLRTSLLFSSFRPSWCFIEPSYFQRRRRPVLVHLSNGDGGEAGRGKKKDGYKLGDISKSFARKFASSVKEVTGKDEYQFGDLSRWIDSRIKESISNVTGSEDYEFGDLSHWADARIKDKVCDVTGKEGYEFGDLSRWLDASAKEKVNEFTNQTTYEVGDISKEVLRRIMNGEYKLEDIALMCKILVTVGMNFSPLASLLPGKLLIELLDYSLAQELGGRFVSAITLELDRRMKGAVTGDENYQVGDLTKKSILGFIGKEEYSFGDITKTVLKNMEDTKTPETIGGIKPFLATAAAKEAPDVEARKVRDDDVIDAEVVEISDIDPKIIQELLDWDRALGAIEEKKKPDVK